MMMHHLQIEIQGGAMLRGWSEWQERPTAVAVTLFDDTPQRKAWTFNVDEAKIKAMQEASRNEKLEEYLRQAFANQEESGAAFLFVLKEDKLTWKVVGDLTITLGTFDLTEADFAEAERQNYTNMMSEIKELRQAGFIFGHLGSTPTL